MTGSITSRMPRGEYDAIAALNISRLKELRRSPLHYRHLLTHPRTTGPMTLGTATHVAVLEPERFDSDFAIWNRTTGSGRSAPRNGGYWDAFCEEHVGQNILTADEGMTAMTIAKAVRGEPLAFKYLALGEPEVVLQWTMRHRKCKGRVDWMTHVDGEPYIVGVKTARDCRHFAFGAQSAKLGYHQQWAWYHDGYQAIRGHKPALVEIVVESAAPHAVAVYRIGDDIIEQGRDEYRRLMEQLAICEETDAWPGPVPHEEFLTLPSYAYKSDDEISDLGLVA